LRLPVLACRASPRASCVLAPLHLHAPLSPLFVRPGDDRKSVAPFLLGSCLLSSPDVATALVASAPCLFFCLCSCLLVTASQSCVSLSYWRLSSSRSLGCFSPASLFLFCSCFSSALPCRFPQLYLRFAHAALLPVFLPSLLSLHDVRLVPSVFPCAFPPLGVVTFPPEHVSPFFSSRMVVCVLFTRSVSVVLPPPSSASLLLGFVPPLRSFFADIASEHLSCASPRMSTVRLFLYFSPRVCFFLRCAAPVVFSTFLSRAIFSSLLCCVLMFFVSHGSCRWIFVFYCSTDCSLFLSVKCAAFSCPVAS